MSAIPENGIVPVPGNHSVDETVSKLQETLKAKGVKLFVVIDHSGEAAAIFGNPKAGTPLMLASPSAALDLPLKILVAEDSAGKTWISYNAAAYLQTRHKLPAGLLPNIAVIEALARQGCRVEGANCFSSCAAPSAVLALAKKRRMNSGVES